jgi:hypothetical protein
MKGRKRDDSRKNIFGIIFSILVTSELCSRFQPFPELNSSHGTFVHPVFTPSSSNHNVKLIPRRKKEKKKAQNTQNKKKHQLS